MKRIPKQEYTAEFKEQAVKRAYEVGSIARTAEELGPFEQTLCNWVKAAKAGKLNPAGARQITVEQMELSRLRAQVGRLKMELEITKKRRHISQRSCCEICLNREAVQIPPVACPVRRPVGEPERLLGLAGRWHARAQVADRCASAGPDSYDSSGGSASVWRATHSRRVARTWLSNRSSAYRTPDARERHPGAAQAGATRPRRTPGTVCP